MVISPEIEIGKAILEVLKIPGTSEVLTLADKRVYLLAFRCQNSCPLIQTPLVHLERLAPELDVNIVSIVRGGRSFIPRGGDVINPGDEIYFLVSADKIADTIRDFGMERTPNEKSSFRRQSHCRLPRFQTGTGRQYPKCENYRRR